MIQSNFNLPPQVKMVDPHDYLEVTKRGVVWIALIGTIAVALSIALSIVLSIAAPTFLPAWVAIPFLVALALIVFLMMIIKNVMDNTHSFFDHQLYEWQEHQAHYRAADLQRIEVERERVNIEVTAKKGSTVNIADTITNQALIIQEAKANTRNEFMRHFSEFLQESERLRKLGDGKTGMERRLWLQADGRERGDYKFDADGKVIDRAEYDSLIEFANLKGLLPEGRRKGSAGKVIEGKFTPIE